MKICYIFSSYHLADITGQPAVISRVADFAKENGNEVFIISNSDRTEDLSIQDKHYLILKGLGSFKTYFAHVNKIINYIKEIKPDVIHVHGYLLAIFTWFIHKFTSGKLIVSVCEAPQLINGFYRKIFIFCMKNTENIIVSSQYIKNELMEGGLAADKILVARIGLNDKFIASVSAQEEPDTDILYYGDSSRERGFDIIFHLAKLLPDLRFKVLLRWQNKDCQNELEQMKNLPNATIMQYPYTESTPQIILRSKLVVLPYRWMWVRPPLTLIEPMALGKCVVTSRMGGNDEIITDGYNGIILDFSDIKDAASRISLLVKDEALINNIGKNAAKSIREKYSSLEYDKILTIYKNAQ